jgi:DNA-binding NtrC family response regulator
VSSLLGPVLIVEDEPVLLDGLARYLRRENILALKAGTAERALHILRGIRVRVVVCDNGLELTNGGMKLLDLVKQWYPETRRIIMTGALTEEISEFAHVRGIEAIQKDMRNSHRKLLALIMRELSVG